MLVNKGRGGHQASLKRADCSLWMGTFSSHKWMTTICSQIWWWHFLLRLTHTYDVQALIFFASHIFNYILFSSCIWIYILMADFILGLLFDMGPSKCNLYQQDSLKKILYKWSVSLKSNFQPTGSLRWLVPWSHVMLSFFNSWWRSMEAQGWQR